jgi:hypothetical protein
MHRLIRIASLSAILLLSSAIALAQPSPSPDDHDSLVIVFKDGHREKLSGPIDRIEFDDSAVASLPGRSHFLGKWEVGQGIGGGRFFITLEANGDAKKTLGSSHGTWTLVDGQARISWDDGWHDVIRKVGGKHEKLAYEPGKSFDDAPTNVTAARNTEQKPI